MSILHRHKQIRERLKAKKAAPVRVDLKSLSWDELRDLAKKKGINSFGKSRETLESEIQL